MGFNNVYQSLQELFPQIDDRALRAVAIEHWKDVDAAVDAVLEEIIPFFIERSTPSSPLNQSICLAESSQAALSDAIVGTQTEDDPLVNTMGSARLQNDYNLNCGNQQSLELNEPFCYAYDGHYEGEDNTAELSLSEKNHESMKMSAVVHSRSEPVVLIDLNAAETLQIEVLGPPETEETISGDKLSESRVKISSDIIPQRALICFGEVGNKENDEIVGPLESSAQLVEVADTHGSKLEKSEGSLSTNALGDELTLNAAMSQSSQARVVDLVEEIIQEARDNKKTLFTAMDSLISLMRQVELKEQAVEQAKQEAMIGGKHILDKVEELKQMLQHAKEANDMHSGEVYGEKAILGTELRELQSRVLSLSDERDKSLAVLDEMRQTLEVRLASAENEIRSAEQEKLEKEKAARELLADQELIMEKVVQESKILKQQAEDNAKLQEFLVDRGHVVDTLQGEIGVICQDVRVLKEKFDEHVPLSKSLFSSHTSFILASSNSSSSKSLNTDQVEPLPVGDDLLETQKKGDDEHFSEEEKANRENRDGFVDDGWDFFEEHEINA